MRHSQGEKVKGQGHKVMRRSSTKTSNISRKRHSVVEMHLSYRKSWSLNTMVRAVFRTEAELTLFLRMRTKKSPKHSENVFRQKSYFPVTGNGGRQENGEVRFLTGSS